MDGLDIEGIPDGFDDDVPRLTSREAAETLMAVVERAGHPWKLLRGSALMGDERLTSSRRWPLAMADGELLGIVVREDDGPTDHDELVSVLLRTLSSLVAAERSASEARRRVTEAEHEARVDSLTGLPNRRAWEAALAAESARMARHERAALVLVVDLDGLKETNDSEGHLAGDLLLRRAAAVIRGVVRDEDLVARLGGDEFAVLAVEAGPPAERCLLERLRAALLEADIDASVGAALAPPGGSLADAVHEADRHMYVAKQRRKELAAGALRDAKAVTRGLSAG